VNAKIGVYYRRTTQGQKRPILQAHSNLVLTNRPKGLPGSFVVHTLRERRRKVERKKSFGERLLNKRVSNGS